MKNKQLIALTALLTAISGLSLPAMAQHSIEPGQPIVGSIHVREAVLDSQLTNDFNAGLIDPLELANMRRDLDAIKCKEESYRMRSQGLTTSAEARIAARLDVFQDALMAKEAGKGAIASATYTIIR